jgi:hypothetical protein
LELHLVRPDLHPAELEVHPNGGKQLFVELAVYELAKQGRLSLIGNRVPTAESPTSTSLYSPATTGIIINMN